MRTRSWILFGVLACASGSALSHGGGLNAEGCHNNRKTGDYHCHRGGGSAGIEQALPAQAAAPAQRSEVEPTTAGPKCYTGPRGGTYTITKSGRKNYKGC
jgi:hypothetical protein